MGPIEQVLPDWVPEIAITYLNHTTLGVPIRQIAREKGCHASTVLRQVRKFESLRDDPLVDTALTNVARDFLNPPPDQAEFDPMKTEFSDRRTHSEAIRILRRLCENHTYLLVADKARKAVVFKEVADSNPKSIASVDREFALRFALQEWISGTQIGSVGRYTITSVGRTALKRMLSDAQSNKSEHAGDSSFRDQHRDYGLRTISEGFGQSTQLRVNLSESPLAVLGRRRGQDGIAFLSSDLIDAGERLREDFELAQMGPRVAQNWDRFLNCGATSGFSGNSAAEGPTAARDRVNHALKVLGPGLGDVALRVCCFLDGLEKAEKRLGWSARSGKVVLRIALQRLAYHYGIAQPEDTRKVG
ncbi:MAG: helix-turn-helix domain-containing protein [Rhodobacteraceae bacterium]|nr:helix-turn-helix domain-containing protein [Paracoccaceae bacterium]